jgi:CHAT domain-containing protein
MLINLITRDTVMVVQKETGGSIIPLVEDFIKETSTPFNGFSTREDIRRFFENGYALYSDFLDPVSQFIGNKKLILAPDEVLASFPFEALVTRKPDDKTLFNNAPWLIQEHSVSYLYNAALLPSVNDKDQSFSELAAFAPDYHGTAAMHDSVLLDIRQGLNSKLRPIPGAMEEVNQIIRLFKGQKFTGSDASIGHFEEQLHGDKILHLAMHSLISGRDPMESKLVFSPGATDSSGVLEAHQIYNFQINSPLIALSSCNSGAGKSLAGEGIMSLSRAFTFAGAKSTLMTLWAVNDKAASRLVSSFYMNLKEGFAKDEALSKAKRDFLKNASPLSAHPYYWANYVISGNQTPLIEKASVLSVRTIVLLGMGILLLMVLLYVRASSKKRKTNQTIK